MKIGIAGTGAGKTTAMADTIIKFRSEIEDHKKIFCITFEGNPLVAMYWQHRFNRMVGRYNDIYRVQMPHYTSCMPTYLLFQYGKIGNESENATIPHGTFGHQRYHECVHAYQF